MQVRVYVYMGPRREYADIIETRTDTYPTFIKTGLGSLPSHADTTDRNNGAGRRYQQFGAGLVARRCSPGTGYQRRRAYDRQDAYFRQGSRISVLSDESVPLRALEAHLQRYL